MGTIRKVARATAAGELTQDLCVGDRFAFSQSAPAGSGANLTHPQLVVPRNLRCWHGLQHAFSQW